MKNTGSEKNQRKIFQPTKETETKLNLICEATGMTISDVVNSLFDTLDCVDQMIEAYHRARKEYLAKMREIMFHVVPEEVKEAYGQNKPESAESLERTVERE